MSEHRDWAPLYEALLQYKSRKDVSFHVPGHKDGQALQFAGSENGHLLSKVMEIDTTEITGTDDLHHPEGVILAAQQLAAEEFGAEETFFLVGGSTAGNLALILSVCTAPGDVLLVQRNVHKSVIHGLMLAHAHAVFLAPQLDAPSGLATIPSEATVCEALRRYPGAKGLLLTHPSYYGMGAPLRPLAKLCRASGVPLLVDEAHGAHFGQHPALPESALAAGADGVVQSTHKMLSALTMGAMLHVQGSLLDRGLLRQRLAMVQSSSPSYPIMASLDLTRSMLHSQGPGLFEEGLAAAKRVREGLRQIPRFGMVEPLEASGGHFAYTIQDPFKIVIFDTAGYWSGYKLQRMLENEGCVPEMSDERYVVLAVSQGTKRQDAEQLLQVLEKISNNGAIKAVLAAHGPTGDSADSIINTAKGRSTNINGKMNESLLSTWNIFTEEEAISSTPTMGVKSTDLSLKTDFESDISFPVPFGLQPISSAEKEIVPVEESAGRQSAEMIIPYPPGIPLLYPGETITKNTMIRLIELRNSNAKCQGATDPLLETITIIPVQDESREQTK